MKLSIIVPVYNVQPYIETCIKSIIGQRYFEQNCELIIVNDCTPDESMKLARNITINFKNIIYINHGTNLGLSVARNTGSKRANGEYVWFIDSDDWISEGSITKILKSIEYQPDIIHIGHARTDRISNNINQKIPPYPLSGADLLLLTNPPSHVPCYIWRADFLKRNGLEFYPGIYHEDNLFTPSALVAAERVAIIKDPLYRYTIRENSITSSGNFKKRATDVMVVLRELMEKHEAQQHSRRQREALIKYIGITVGAVFYYWRRLPWREKRDVSRLIAKSKISHYPIKYKYIVALVLMKLIQ